MSKGRKRRQCFRQVALHSLPADLLLEAKQMQKKKDAEGIAKRLISHECFQLKL